MRMRPRVLYYCDDRLRVAVGRRFEPASVLLAEIEALYPDCGAMIVTPGELGLEALAEYAAGWIATAKEAAAKLGMRKASFLALAKDGEAVEVAAILDDDLHRRLWHREPELVPEPDGQRRGIAKAIQTGEYTTRGKPKLRKIGAECWYGGENLHRSPPINGVVQRWTERDLLGFPYPGDWGTQPYRRAEQTATNLPNREPEGSIAGA